MNEKIRKVLADQNENYIFPFFWLHGETEETLREYMKVIDESNIKAVCVESRPHPDFCGEQWWKDMDIILDEARNRQMKVWILDDSHFPTGYAAGAMKDQPDSRCRQSICCKTCVPENSCVYLTEEDLCHPKPFEKTMIENYAMEKDVREFDDDRLLAVFALEAKSGRTYNLMPFVKENQIETVLPEGNWTIYILHLSRNQGYHRSYINMMDEYSCKVLLDAVYEPHYEHYKEDFGKTIAGFFSDEPELGNGHMYNMEDGFGTPNDYPWSQELETCLEERMGEDYPQLLAYLWEDKGEPTLTAKARYAYMDTVTELVKKDFSEQIGSWCREHGVQYIGHLIEDDNHHSRTGSSLGHYFRGLYGQDMAGIDDIGGQVFPQGEDVHYNDGIFHHRNGEFYHYLLGKLASSAAAIEPGKNGNSMCEIFGNYGWAEGVRLEKYLADHFLVRGINHFVPHAFSPKEFPDQDCPPHFYAHGNNPQYRHFGCLMSYMNRLCELLSGGKHISTTAVLYHGEGDWTGRHMTAEKVGHILSDHQIEYDILPQEVFAQRKTYQTVVKNRRLCVNTQQYRMVLVPYMQFLTKPFAEAVTELIGQEVPVLFVGGYPEGICDTKADSMQEDKAVIEKIKAVSQSIELEKLLNTLCKDNVKEIQIVPENARIRYRHYVHDDGTEIWFFVNEGTETYQGQVQFQNVETENSDAVAYEYAAWENKTYAIAGKEKEIKLVLEPLKSSVIVFEPSSEKESGESLPCRENTEKHLMEKERKKQSFDSVWKRSVCRSIEYPAFGAEKEIDFPDCLAKEEPEFSGFVRYENAFTAEGTEELWLEITDAYEGVEVFLNGVSLGIQIVPGYRFYLTPALTHGKNHLRIEVATTLEREMAKYPDFLGRTQEAKALSGITGEVNLWKLQ